MLTSPNYSNYLSRTSLLSLDLSPFTSNTTTATVSPSSTTTTPTPTESQSIENSSNLPIALQIHHDNQLIDNQYEPIENYDTDSLSPLSPMSPPSDEHHDNFSLLAQTSSSFHYENQLNEPIVTSCELEPTITTTTTNSTTATTTINTTSPNLAISSARLPSGIKSLASRPLSTSLSTKFPRVNLTRSPSFRPSSFIRIPTVSRTASLSPSIAELVSTYDNLSTLRNHYQSDECNDLSS
ncbi:unnamed protein product [Schistosoma turkestanicum]|nr:unnamed protein product [Schistosoma turkestanicum]